MVLTSTHNLCSEYEKYQSFLSEIFQFLEVKFIYIQYNLNGSNQDGSVTMDDSNSFFSPYKSLPIAQENKYLGIFSYFIIELYVVCTH